MLWGARTAEEKNLRGGAVIVLRGVVAAAAAWRAHNPRRSGPFDARGARCNTIRGGQGHVVGG